VERQKIKNLIKEAKHAVQNMKSSEPISSLAGRTLDGSVILELQGQTVKVAVDERLRKR
jgi:hypothetical protein